MELEHGKRPWMLTGTEIKLRSAVNMILQHFWLNVSLRQAATGRWHKIQTVDVWGYSTETPAVVPWLCYSVKQRDTGGDGTP